MSLTGQGLASGFQGGFKMMDDYYNRQENQLRNKEASDINKQNAKSKQSLTKIKRRSRLKKRLSGLPLPPRVVACPAE